MQSYVLYKVFFGLTIIKNKRGKNALCDGAFNGAISPAYFM